MTDKSLFELINYHGSLTPSDISDAEKDFLNLFEENKLSSDHVFKYEGVLLLEAGTPSRDQPINRFEKVEQAKKSIPEIRAGMSAITIDEYALLGLDPFFAKQMAESGEAMSGVLDSCTRYYCAIVHYAKSMATNDVTLEMIANDESLRDLLIRKIFLKREDFETFQRAQQQTLALMTATYMIAVKNIIAFAETHPEHAKPEGCKSILETTKGKTIPTNDMLKEFFDEQTEYYITEGERIYGKISGFD